MAATFQLETGRFCSRLYWRKCRIALLVISAEILLVSSALAGPIITDNRESEKTESVQHQTEGVGNALSTGSTQNYSGAWYDPKMDGEGYQIFQTPFGWLVFFFGYDNEGHRLWLISEVLALDTQVIGEPFGLEMYVGDTGWFQNPAKPEDLELYGMLWVTFLDCDSGVFILDGRDGEKTSEVVKLVGVEGTECNIQPGQIEIDEFLATPAEGYAELVPVVMISHIPTKDGISLDLEEANYDFRPPEWRNNSVSDLIDYINLINIRKKFMLEEMSRFRGYKIPTNTPFLGYKVLAHYVVYEPLPLDSRANPFDANQKMVDFKAVLERIDAKSWVNDQSVQEFWFNNYHNPKFQFWESNMSSPTTSDISNSDRFSDDLPIYNRTYFVYGTNYHRTQAEAVHNHGHQIEQMLDFIDRRASGTSDLFWGAYVGVPDFPGPAMVPGRCGWTHQPPNTTIDYGYLDETMVDVDCEDWRPDGLGQKRPVNSSHFDQLQYQWPNGDNQVPQRTESHFYIWWGQNMPGDDNQIPYQSTTMENWWRIISDWDSAVNDDIRLYR